MSFKHFTATLLWCAFHLTSVQASENSVEETKIGELVKIYTLEGHCDGSYCGGFEYENVSQVAFFDLKAEVRINDESSTYDIIKPVELDSLIFENSTFAHFPLHLFYSVGASELDIRNCSVETVTWENFLMADRLSILLLSNNKITKIDELTFNYASELQYLFLDANRINNLVSESFKGLTKLRYLDLRHNRLWEIPADMFDYLPSLQELHLDHNRLRVITNDMFAKNPQLLTLTISTNNLLTMGEHAFENQTDLILLDMAHNTRLESLVMTLKARNLVAANCSLYRVNVYGSVSNVDLRDNVIRELYFAQPESLDTLNLRNNSLEQIASLTRAINLRHLDLSHNPEIESLPHSWSVNSLERLDLSGTGMKQMPIASLAEQTNLRFLNVSQNKLRDIDPSNFQYLKQLKFFHIHANDWNCYNLNMLMDLLIRPYNMGYARDNYDAEFPGEYIYGIACMYRVEEADEEQQHQDSTSNTIYESSVAIPAQLNTAGGSIESVAETDTANLRKELKVVVQFFEDKFDKIFQELNSLNARVENFERMNTSFWQHVTITV